MKMKLISTVGKVLISRRLFGIPKHISSIRAISTSNKKDDTTTVVGPTTTGTAHSENTTSQSVTKKKYFYDYGFGGKTEEEESNLMNAMFFTYVTIGLVFIGFYFRYRPQTSMKDWAQREAYLELRRREQLGLPLIDPNYVDPSTVYLPSDEELGDTEIII